MFRFQNFLMATMLIGHISSPTKCFAATDVIQLTTNMIWCWQTADKVEARYEFHFPDVWNIKIKKGTNISHDQFVTVISKAVDNSDAGTLRIIYNQCQDHNERARQYMETADDSEVLKAGRHTVSCYPSQPPGASRLLSGQGKCVGDVDW